MNWRRGLFRLWAAFTALWLALVVGLTIANWPATPNRADFIFKPVAGSTTGLFDDLETTHPIADREYAAAVADRKVQVRKNLTTGAGFAVLVPAALFVLGWTLLWVARGFRQA